MAFPFTRFSGVGKKTATAGTRIQVVVPGRGGLFAHVMRFRYTVSTTAHTLTLMKGVDRTTLNADAAAGQAVIVVTKALLDGGGQALAANDLLCVKQPNGEWVLVTASSVSADGLTITLTANLALAVKYGARVVMYGVPGDTIHATMQYNSGTSTTKDFPATAIPGSLVAGNAHNDPVVFDSDNGTAAGTLEDLQFAYSRT